MVLMIQQPTSQLWVVIFFCKVAIVAHLKKKYMKRADKTPRNHDQRPFRLDGRMDLTIAFGNKEITTVVYILSWM